MEHGKGMEGMASMAMSKKKMKSMAESLEKSDDGPKFPYGTELRLDDHLMEKLGLKDVPVVGGTMEIHAMGRVTSARSESMQGGKKVGNITVQIEHMSMTSKSLKDSPSDGEAFYPKGK